MPERPLTLILGGSTDAYALARRLVADNKTRCLSSLAGRTQAPKAPEGDWRVGGFGGSDGLAAYLRTEQVAALIDATHPFAARMGWNAAAASAAAGVPLLRLERPAWTPGPGDRWTEVDDWDDAVRILAAPEGPRRVLLALGRQELAPFAGLDAASFLIRSVDPPDPMPPFRQAELLLSRGPFALAEELALLQERGIEAIICKNSGGSGADAKLTAARALGLPVILKRRPSRPVTAVAASVDDAAAWLYRQLGVA